MKRLPFILVCMACVFVSADPQTATAQDEKLVADLEKKVAELQKKVAELQKKVAVLEAALKVAPKPGLDLKLVGSWAAPDAKGETIVAMRFEADGKCRMVVADEKKQLTTWYGRYELTGKVIDLVLWTDPSASGGAGSTMTVVSVGDKELVVRGTFVIRAEVKFEKQ